MAAVARRAMGIAMKAASAANGQAMTKAIAQRRRKSGGKPRFRRGDERRHQERHHARHQNRENIFCGTVSCALQRDRRFHAPAAASSAPGPAASLMAAMSGPRPARPVHTAPRNALTHDDAPAWALRTGWSASLRLRPVRAPRLPSRPAEGSAGRRRARAARGARRAGLLAGRRGEARRREPGRALSPFPRPRRAARRGGAAGVRAVRSASHGRDARPAATRATASWPWAGPISPSPGRSPGSTRRCSPGAPLPSGTARAGRGDPRLRHPARRHRRGAGRLGTRLGRAAPAGAGGVGAGARRRHAGRGAPARRGHRSGGRPGRRACARCWPGTGALAGRG